MPATPWDPPAASGLEHVQPARPSNALDGGSAIDGIKNLERCPGSNERGLTEEQLTHGGTVDCDPRPDPDRPMKRILVTLGLIAAPPPAPSTVAGAADSRTYQAELFNAFGLVKGSELRVAGVKAGTITDLEVTPQKTALVSFEVEPEFPEFKADASCSSEPQSLIAEYFLDCQPGVSPEPSRADPGGPATRPPSSPTSPRTPSASRSRTASSS